MEKKNLVMSPTVCQTENKKSDNNTDLFTSHNWNP